MKLLETLGKSATSPEAARVLADYPGLRAQVDDDVRYLRSERDGLLVKLSGDGEILAIFLMSEGKDGFAQFKGDLPGGFTFQATAPEVLKALGAPAFSQAGGRFGNFDVGQLMRFDRPAHSVHFQFRPDGEGIALVTLMIAAAVPGRSRA